MKIAVEKSRQLYNIFLSWIKIALGLQYKIKSLKISSNQFFQK